MNNPVLEKWRERLKDDLVLFGRTIRPAMAKVNSPVFHNDLSDIWSKRTAKKRVVIQAPRGHAKSEVTGTNIPLHHILYDNGDKFIVLISKTADHAKDLLTKIKETLTSSTEFKTLYGDYGQGSPYVSKWTDREIQMKFYNWRTKKWENVRILTKGMNMMIVGLNFKSQRPTLVIFDDPEDDENTKTIERINSNYNKLEKSILPGLDPLRGVVWVIGTPQCPNGMVNRLEELAAKTGVEDVIRDGCTCYNGEWYSIKYQAIINEETKEVLWKEWLSYDALMAIKKRLYVQGKTSIFNSEYQCELTNDEDGDFLSEDIQYWDGYLELGENFETFLKIEKIGSSKCAMKDVELRIPVNTYMGVDPASSESKTADYSTIVIIAYDEKERIFVLPYFRKRVPPYEHGLQIIEYYKRHRPKSTQIETQGYQVALRNQVRNDSLKQNLYINGLEMKWNTNTNKIMRLRDLVQYFKRRKIYLKPHMAELETELFKFPYMKNDDIIDGLWYATRRMHKPAHMNLIKEYKIQNYRGTNKNWLLNC